MRALPVLIASGMIINSWNLTAASSADSTKHWVGTWACSPYKVNEAKNAPPSELTNNTLRQIVRVSIGGDTVRVKFSNSTCATPVTIKAANIAESPDGTKAPVTESTMTKLTFKGDTSVTMDAQGSAISDPVAFKLKPSARIAITIYYGQCKSSTDMTFHYGSRTNSYFLTGNKLSSADFAGSTTIQRWYTISGIDVIAPTYAGSVVCFGNSITDGYGLSDSPNQPGLQNRWTDIFSERLLANPSTAQVGVLNEGIGATTVLSEGNGAKAGTVRFAPDVLDQAGVRWIIILYGVNDIHGGKSGDQVINDGYKKLIAAAHAKSKEIKVYGGTLTPMGGDAAYASNESARTTINNWIRTAGNFDGVIDFDKAVRDPSNLTSMRSGLANGLHPSVAGYKAMGDSIDLKMFAGPVPVNTAKEVKIQGYSLGDIKSNPVNGNTMVSFEIPNESFVSLKVFSMLGKEVAELGGKNFSTGKHIVQFESKNLPKEMYLFSIKAGAFSDSRKMILPIR